MEKWRKDNAINYFLTRQTCMSKNIKYIVEIKALAEKDLKNIQKNDAVAILDKIISLENGLTGDIKKLTNFSPEYRLRVGNYRILFELEGDKVIIYRVLHRKESYR